MIIRLVKNIISKVIMIENESVLLLERANKSVSSTSPWTLDLPGGHLDTGETYLQAAEREVYEETGLVVRNMSYVGKGESSGKTTWFYTTNDWNNTIKLSNEHKSYKWVKLKDLEKYKEQIGPFYYKMITKVF